MAKTTTAAKQSNGRQGTISYIARALIKSGKTNDQVFKALVRRFGSRRVPARHAHYPAWYRAEMVRRGQITKTWAAKHA